MINRALIRIKIVQILYSYHTNKGKSLHAAEQELLLSLEKTYELYNLLLLLAVDITKYGEKRIEMGKNKLRPTKEELSPNTRFINNKFIAQLAVNTDLAKYVKDNSLSWAEHADLVKGLYDRILASSVYKEYMESKESSYDLDKQLWRKIYRKIFMPDEALNDRLEDICIYWNDDIEIVVSFIEKTIKRFVEEKGIAQELLPMYNEEEDKQFAVKLLRNIISEDERFNALIDEHAKNWEVDRIAFIDVVIMKAALGELTDFPTIPVSVTLNEYIEIAKVYSTDKSSIFVNGILDNIVTTLRNDNKLLKVGFFVKETK